MFANVRVHDFYQKNQKTSSIRANRTKSTDQDMGLSCFAADALATRGRLYQETDCPFRSPFARDRDRIIHSSSFRRLGHKTQVFLSSEGDHFRTRLTHSMEVAQIARSLAHSLRLDEDLTEGISLAHDLGHPPFGHAGERALSRALAGFGGFDHNLQTLRVVTRIDGRYAEHEGLNLSWELLEGLVKHNGPLPDHGCNGDARPSTKPLRTLVAAYHFDMYQQAGAEAQVAAIADDIAYNNHDIDDGVRAGLFAVDELREISLIEPLIMRLRRDYPDIREESLVFELNRRLTSMMIEDVLTETRLRLAQESPKTSDAIRVASRPMVAFSAGMERELASLRQFLYQRVYRSERVMSVMKKAERIIEDLVRYYLMNPERLPKEWSCRKVRVDIKACAEQVRDYVAGMTDRYAIDLHRSLFDVTPKLR